MNDIHYSEKRAASYAEHHNKSLRNRLTSWRERQCLNAALSVSAPHGVVLDMPCGAGRFAHALDGIEVGQIIAGDNSPGMLKQAELTLAPLDIPSTVKLLDAFQIDLPDKSVDFVACMRFFHHLAYAEDRARVFAELKRISKKEIAFSLWVDGNLGAWRRRRRQQAPLTEGFGKRRLIERAVIEKEIEEAGLQVVRHWDMWPGLTMWRQYLVRVPD